MKEAKIKLIKINSFTIQIIKKSLFIIAALLAVALVLNKFSLFWGFLLGGSASIISLILLSYNVEQQLYFGAGLNAGSRFLWLCIRFAIMGIALAIAIKCPYINMAACIIGLFATQAAIFLAHLLPSEQTE